MRKRLEIILVAIMICAGFTGCSKYSSHFSSVMLITSDYKDHGSIEYGQFKGTYVFDFKAKGEKELHYKGKVEKGTVTVYYDSDGTKEELFTLSDGEEIDDYIGDFEDQKIYVIIEIDERSEKGSFSFELV